MPIQTAQTYHEDESLHGKYAYITLKEVLDELLMETVDTDSYLANTPRSKLLTKAKNGIQVLNREVKKTILAAEITVGPKLFIVLPQDFIDIVRISVVTDQFRLKALRPNNNIQTAVGYLQDSDYELLFDNDGAIMMADSSNLYNKPARKYTFCPGEVAQGEYVIDEQRGRIGFSTDLEDKEVVIEYISDGLQMHNLSDSEISIHKNLKQVLMAYVHYETVRLRRSVRIQDKRDFQNRYKALLHTAKMDNLHFNITQLNTVVVADQYADSPKQEITVFDNSSSPWGINSW